MCSDMPVQKSELEMLLKLIDLIDQDQAEVSAMLARAFQMLKIHGVPRKRAPKIAIGIDTLATRMRRLDSEHLEDINRLSSEVLELKNRKFARFNNEDCWIYQKDGDNRLDSLTCPVVISAVDLLGLIGGPES